ncbi:MULTISPECIES: helix-turn-helix domain-containing protein [Bacillus cereus group]|uniref:helix-turn-helix domain-containing protein n=1 Tax=Bacillus cereus group TaxID=86661 RepID=UPI00202CC775|nr:MULTISPECIES: helix-turn-helix transcriptional regulator [unclassified Bacillus cereus group]MCM0002366.1 helix-turn-helix domain-containing protein [Bacillus paranthracis]MDA1954132.1 helix-turn-helix transcriptional regulator [Bacillus cereus group sp. BcHK114]MDA2663964.1 helix-turn-helix transcriptional regulator [Bacillus cereus group sp. Bc032]MDA2674682.1 helix-turn-helix transcriptional regulator [Bacillus cereus group sp. Bc031]MDA2680149.1 helix-turn-helix transcriptional regulato
MATLGEKIKALRKEKKLTQTALAGSELTKSMLSQIENGKATPSMKTLQYIAEKLECETSFLLEEDDDEIVELIQKMERLIKNKCDEVYETLLPIVQKELPSTLNTARLYKQFITAAAVMNDYNIEYYVETAVSIFEKYTLYRESTETKLLFYYMLFKRKKYKECLQLIATIRDEYKAKNLEMDLITHIQLYLKEAIILLAYGNYEKCEKVILDALAFSKKHQVYYKTDEFYRILSYQKIIVADKERYLYYIKKSEQFAIFTEDTLSAANVDILKAYYYNTVTNEYTIALEHLEQFREKLKNDPIFQDDGLYYLEKGKSLYGLKRYKEALETLKHATIPDYMNHPLDQSWVLTAGSYRALCYIELQDKKSALTEAKEAVQAIDSYPDSIFTSFIKETLQIIQKL